MAYEYKFIELRKILENSHLGLYRPGYYFGLNGLEIEVRKDAVKLYGVTDLKEKIGIQIKVDNDIYYKTEELKEVYRKAKAYDLLKEDLLINEKVFREQAENDEVSDIIHGHYVALLVQAELERADDER
ncbi:Uncharacterised protein [Staphylococcus xylosus]|uniref:hypothetical protein n=1 Tax=Staphylococcus xylosus TaxID=1288 RepID=UPI00085BC7A2|nr:hypothetical protein [Staphylococcus xylosus]SCU31564.1 Uncharacterised protein [Staphylococcus xylosus]